MQQSDGGQAFPMHDRDDALRGMTLRQWYAGQVISPQLVQAYGNTPHILARRAFEIADAMIEADRTTDTGEEQADG